MAWGASVSAIFSGSAASAMTASTVTLITPVYNQAAYVRATIESVRAQTCSAIDYRVIDDGSTDATPAILAEYAGQVAVTRQANCGQAATLDRGWREGNGRYLSYLSADDLLAPNAIARMVSVLDADPDAVCAFPDFDLIDARGAVFAQGLGRPFDLADSVINSRCFIGPGAVFRADAWRAAGGWRSDLVLAPDREFWMRLAAHGRIVFVPEQLAQYRHHRRALSHAPVSEARACEYLRVLDLYFARDDVPAPIRARREEAYARANLIIARLLLRAGRVVRAAHYVRRTIGTRGLGRPRLAPGAALRSLRMRWSALAG